MIVRLVLTMWICIIIRFNTAVQCQKQHVMCMYVGHKAYLEQQVIAFVIIYF